MTHRDGRGSELLCSELECWWGGHNRDSIQKRAPKTFETFYTDIRRMSETTNETAAEAEDRLLPARLRGLAMSDVRRGLRAKVGRAA